MLRTLHSRLLSSHLLVAVVALGLVGLLSSQLLRHYFVVQTRDSLMQAADDIAVAMGGAFGEADRRERIAVIAHTASRALGGRVCVMGTDDRNLLASSDLKRPSAAPDLSNLLYSAGSCTIEETQALCYPGPTITVTTPIMAPGTDTQVGALILRRPLREVEATLRMTTWVIVASGILAGLLALGLAAFAARTVSGPLSEMAHAASDLAEGDFTARVRRQGPVELRTVASSLNHMADALAEAFEDLSAERTRLADIVSSMQEGVLGLDGEGKVTLTNQGLRDLLGAQADDWVGKPFASMPIAAELVGCVQDVLSGAKDGFTCDLVLEDAVLRVRGAKVLAQQVGAVLVFTDVTEAERLERLRREFVANASHELRAPLTSIQGYIGAILDGTATTEEERERCLRVADRQAGLMRRLVDQLLDLSRLQAGVVPLDLEELHMGDLIAAALEAMRPQADAKSIRLSANTDNPPPVTGDGDRLMRVLINLIDNAIRHSPEGGQVTVSAAAVGADGGSTGWLEVTVRDQGPGIPEEEITHIWERFHKVDKSRGPADTGAGLGLAIAREIIAHHHGRVHAGNSPEGGAVLGFLLPLVSDTDA